MIALDTNILVRYLVQDDKKQSLLAREFIENHCNSENPAFISVTTIVETYWVLKNIYGFGEAHVREGLGKLLETEQVSVEQDEAIMAALGLSHPDLADAIIFETGRFAGATSLLTFDKKFARVPGVELLK